MKVADTVDRSAHILKFSYTVGWLLDSLMEHDKVFIEWHGHRTITEVTAVDISVGKGFVSSVLRCTLTFADSKDAKDVYTTVMKLPGVESLTEMGHDTGMAEVFDDDFQQKCVTVHQFECEFYNKIAPHLNIPLPRVFQTVEWVWEKQEGVLHMEDLGQIGKTLDPGENVNLAQIKSLARNLARMHKSVLSMDTSQWKGLFTPNWDILKTVLKMISTSVEPFLKFCPDPDGMRALLDEVLPFLQSADVHKYVYFDSWKEENLTPVITHGDCWAGNIMWKTDEQGEIVNDIAAIIDWQIIAEGSPMADIVRLATLCAPSYVRRRAEETIIDYYLECLQKEFGEGVKLPYTKKQLERSYKLNVLTQAGMLIAVLPFFSSARKNDLSERQLNAMTQTMAVNAKLAMEDVKELLNGDLKDIKERFSPVAN